MCVCMCVCACTRVCVCVCVCACVWEAHEKSEIGYTNTHFIEVDSLRFVHIRASNYNYMYTTQTIVSM